VKILYISYDGMTDQLGQSQVLPYLSKLSDTTTQIFLMSFEKKEKFEAQRKKIEEIISKAGIIWLPLTYTKKPPVLSTLWDLMQMQRAAFRLHREQRFDIVHCRSYIASLIGLKMKQKFGIRFIFDMRGFYADERVDGGLWNLKNPLYKAIYQYFKRQEIKFLQQADYTITLTYAAREIIHQCKIAAQPIPIEMIPCCVDLELFDPEKINSDKKEKILAECNLTGNEFIVSYIGSLGTWYMLDEMLRFFKRLLLKKSEAVFLIVTQDDSNLVLNLAERLGIPKNKFRFKKAAREEVPACIAVSNASLFFIQPVFSKKASSPTKQGEIMAMGVPIVCNNSVGDTDKVIHQYHAGWVTESFTDEEFDKVIASMETPLHKKRIIQGAKEFYSLEQGVQRYRNVYSKVMAK